MTYIYVRFIDTSVVHLEKLKTYFHFVSTIVISKRLKKTSLLVLLLVLSSLNLFDQRIEQPYTICLVCFSLVISLCYILIINDTPYFLIIKNISLHK